MPEDRAEARLEQGRLMRAKGLALILNNSTPHGFYRNTLVGIHSPSDENNVWITVYFRITKDDIIVCEREGDVVKSITGITPSGEVYDRDVPLDFFSAQRPELGMLLGVHRTDEQREQEIKERVVDPDCLGRLSKRMNSIPT